MRVVHAHACVIRRLGITYLREVLTRLAQTTHERGCIAAVHPRAYDTESAHSSAENAMEAARLMRGEDTGHVPVVGGESLSTRSEPASVAVDGQQNLDEGLRLMFAKVVEVISK